LAQVGGQSLGKTGIAPIRFGGEILGIGESHEAHLGKHIDGGDLATALLGLLQAVSMRGWLVPGFWPMTKIASAFSKSSRLTVPLPTPITFSKAQPLDSWHVLEQSGKLFVPNCRGEKLIQEGCLVARLARSVKRGMVRRPQAVHCFSNQLERRIPGGRPVVI